MSDNDYLTYFGQAATIEGTTGENGGGTSQTLSAGLPGRSTDPVGSEVQITSDAVHHTGAEPEKDLFQASLISRMDSLIRDFGEAKTLCMETLYQVLHEASVSESI